MSFGSYYTNTWGRYYLIILVVITSFWVVITSSFLVTASSFFVVITPAIGEVIT
jgi:hypothetical protein